MVGVGWMGRIGSFTSVFGRLNWMDVLSVCVDGYMLQDFVFVVFWTAHFL